MNFAREPAVQLDFERYNGLVVLGGPMNVDPTGAYPHLLTEIAAIRAALGATVRPNRVREIGWYRLQPAQAARADRLFRHFDAVPHVPVARLHLRPAARRGTPREHRFAPAPGLRYGNRAYGLPTPPKSAPKASSRSCAPRPTTSVRRSA